MPQFILDKAYRVSESILPARMVVQGTNAGECAYPAANAGSILGVTLHGQTDTGRAVTVRKAGIAEVTAAGTIPVGAPVNASGTNGKVKVVNESPGTKVEILGFAETPSTGDGDIIEVYLCFHQRTA